MRIAALYDIHANVPALEAVLQDVRDAGVDQVVVGGDVVPGPMPCDALALLLKLDVPVQFIHGNGELAVLTQIGAADSDAVTYWARRPANRFQNLFVRSSAGRHGRSILTTMTCYGAGPKLGSSTSPASVGSCSVMGHHEARANASRG